MHVRVCNLYSDRHLSKESLAVSLNTAHIDHIRPLSSGGSNHASNLRTLCPVCHGLRLDRQHNGMRNRQVLKGLIPVNWKQFVWD